jgi:hypothetical protein
MTGSACSGQLIAAVTTDRKNNVFIDFILSLVFLNLRYGIYRILLLSLNRFLAKTLFKDYAI